METIELTICVVLGTSDKVTERKLLFFLTHCLHWHTPSIPLQGEYNTWMEMNYIISYLTLYDAMNSLHDALYDGCLDLGLCLGAVFPTVNVVVCSHSCGLLKLFPSS